MRRLAKTKKSFECLQTRNSESARVESDTQQDVEEETDPNDDAQQDVEEEKDPNDDDVGPDVGQRTGARTKRTIAKIDYATLHKYGKK